MIPLQVAPEEFLTDPASVYSQLGPVQEMRGPDGFQYYLITRYELAKAALLDRRLVNNPGADDDRYLPLINSDGADHSRLRAVLAHDMNHKQIEHLRYGIQRTTDELLDEFPEHGVVDLVSRLAFPLPVRTLCALLGVPERHREPFEAFAAMAMGTSLSHAEKSRRIRIFFTRLVTVRRRDPNPTGLLATLIKACEEGRITERELVGLCVVLFVAGLETTTNLISNGVVTMLLADQFQAPDAAALEELIRYEGSASQAAIRLATEDVTIEGVTIPAGSMVQIGLAGANRDLAEFAEPHRLDLARNPNRHLAFGHGVHFCLGAPLARVQASIALGSLARRHPSLTLACTPEELRWVPIGALHRLDTVPVRL